MGSKLAEKPKRRSGKTVQPPQSRETLQAEVGKKGYRVVAVSLYTLEAQWIEETTRAIQKAGNPKANRSFLVREAIMRLRETFRDMKPEQMVENIAETLRRRSQS